MTPPDDRSHPRTLADIGYQFLLGAVLGLVLALIPLAITVPTLTLWNSLATATLVLFCGILSALFGKRLLHGLIQFLESFPPVA